MNEFDIRLGDWKRGTVNAVIAALKYGVLPFFLLILLTFVGDRADMSSAWTVMINDVRFIVLMFAVPLVILAFFKWFYPAGSYSRLIFALVMAPVVLVELYILLLGGSGDTLLVEMELDLDIMIIFYLAIGAVAFSVLADLGEYADNRRDLLSWMADRFQTPRPQPRPVEDPKQHKAWHDFRFRYGRYAEGFRTARKAFMSYVFWPLIIFLLLLASLTRINEEAGTMLGDIETAVERSSTFVLLLGLPIVALSFFRGFYPKGSVSRMTFWLAVVVVTVFWIWEFALGGIAALQAGDMADVTVNYQAIILLFIFVAALWGVYAIAEMLSYRKDWIRNDFRPVDEDKAKKDRELAREERRAERERSKKEPKL